MAYPKQQPKINAMSDHFKQECEVEGRLLPHQIEALNNLHKWFDGEPNANKIALVCMPTGSGKTGIIACLPYYLASIRLENGERRYIFDKPILVVAPDLAIQNQLVEQLTPLSLTPGSETRFLIRRNIVPDHCQEKVLPTAIKIETRAQLSNQPNLRSNELIIANSQKFVGENWMDQFDNNFFCLVIIDEAHHHPAATWRRIVEKFHNPECPVVFLTATPFRTDGQRVLTQEPGIAYRFSLNDAVRRRIIRQSRFQEIDQVGEPNILQPLQGPCTDNERHYAGNMVPILAEVERLLKEKREKFPLAKHMAIAICKNTRQATILLRHWQNSFPDESAECYHSQKDKKKEIMEKLKNNELSLVVIVAMLLEGFDHPPISIAAITYRMQSPVRFVQFVGRAQRIYRREGYDESEGDEVYADIVTHTEYNQRPNYNNFIEEKSIAELEENNID